MGAGDFSVALPPAPTNEPVRDYAPGHRSANGCWPRSRPWRASDTKLPW